MRKQQFYLALGVEAPTRDTFQESLTDAYENGVEPLDYEESTANDKDGNKITDIILLRFSERWKGAAKRYLRKNKYAYLQRSHDGLNVYG